MTTPSGDAVNARIDSFSLGIVISDSAATTAAGPPAGGAGATAGAYSSAANRDLMISSQNNMRLDLDELHTTVNDLLAELRRHNLIPQ